MAPFSLRDKFKILLVLFKALHGLTLSSNPNLIHLLLPYSSLILPNLHSSPVSQIYQHNFASGPLNCPITLPVWFFPWMSVQLTSPYLYELTQMFFSFRLSMTFIYTLQCPSHSLTLYFYLFTFKGGKQECSPLLP